jgi:inner membrane protein
MSYWVWFVGGTALLIIEIIAPHLVTIWFALAALLTGIVAYWVYDFPSQLAFFAVSSLISFSVGWFWLRKSMKMNLRPLHGKESIAGEAGTVISSDGEQTSCGRVRFQGPLMGDEVWEYISDDRLAAGERCIVTELIGSKVKVKKG